MMSAFVTEAIGDRTSLPVKPLLRLRYHHAATRSGTAVIAILHDLNLAMRFADRIIPLRRGRLAIGGLRETVTSEIIRRIFGIDAPIHYTGDRTPFSVAADDAAADKRHHRAAITDRENPIDNRADFWIGALGGADNR